MCVETDPCVARYDGIYKVVKYWPEEGKSKFIVWRFQLRRDDPAPAPWTKEGKKRIEEGGWGELRKPENYDEAQAEKLKAKAAKLDEKENDSGNKKARGEKRKGKVEEGEETEAKREKKAPVAKFKIPADIQAAMASDKVNKRLWSEIQSREFNTRKDLVDFAEELLQCQFCMSLVTFPVTTQCSHSCCKSCLQRGFKSGLQACSICRADIQDTKLEVNKEMRECLLLIFPGYEN